MKFSWVVRHPINQTASVVFDQMNEQLFEVLSPPKWMAVVERNDGVKVGDEIWVKLKFPISGFWKTCIIERVEEAPYSFTDESKFVLPFGMRYWKHVHRVVPVDNQTCKIEEHVTWESSNWRIGIILNLGFWLMMRGRRKMYQKYFEKNAFGVDMK